MPPAGARRWLVLVHAIPPKPDYLRVKIGRRLARMGAVPLKNSVYLLPGSDEAAEDFQWVLREVVAGGGTCTICDAVFVGGLDDDSAVALFHEARDREYSEIAAEAARIPESLADGDEALRARMEGELVRLRRRLGEVSTIDFFHADGGGAAETALLAAEAALREATRSAGGGDAPVANGAASTGAPRGRTWATRRGIKVDRIASAWLIRRFIDPEARFRFVAPAGFRPDPGELRFDMFDAEYTHEGARCTFETLLARFGLGHPALAALAEIVHDIDLKEHTFRRAETAGVARLIDGLVAAHPADEDRLRHGSALLDALYAGFAATAAHADRGGTV